MYSRYLYKASVYFLSPYFMILCVLDISVNKVYSRNLDKASVHSLSFLCPHASSISPLACVFSTSLRTKCVPFISLYNMILCILDISVNRYLFSVNVQPISENMKRLFGIAYIRCTPDIFTNYEIYSISLQNYFYNAYSIFSTIKRFMFDGLVQF